MVALAGLSPASLIDSLKHKLARRRAPLKQPRGVGFCDFAYQPLTGSPRSVEASPFQHV